MFQKFIFLSYAYEESSATATLSYRFDGGPVFDECITFNDAPKGLSSAQRTALDICLHHLHLAAGVSYYKAYIPPVIQIDSGSLSAGEAEFFNEFYIEGLAEFAYRNGIEDLRDRIKFPFSEKVRPVPSNIKLTPRTAIPVGGGKDSIVTVEALKGSPENLVLFSLGNSKRIEGVIRKTQLPFINVTRKISPRLLELNKDSAILNGHVPITGILSFITVAAAVIYGFDSIAMSNERSADEGNVISGSDEVNHQYSKSSRFENAFRHHVRKSVLSNIEYFSFLRPLTELGITSLFASLNDYHHDFLSCNKAYRVRVEDRMDHWCGDCPKCRFVFLALAPFVNKDTLVDIFTKNLLDDTAQENGYRELLGVTGHKPFECVGQVNECRAAFAYLCQTDHWRGARVIKRLSPLLVNDRDDLQNFLVLQESNTLPDRFKNYLHEFARSKWQENRHLGLG